MFSVDAAEGLFNGWNSACMWTFSNALPSRLQKIPQMACFPTWQIKFVREWLFAIENTFPLTRWLRHYLHPTVGNQTCDLLFFLSRKSICHICHSKLRCILFLHFEKIEKLESTKVTHSPAKKWRWKVRLNCFSVEQTHQYVESSSNRRTNYISYNRSPKKIMSL